MYQTLKEGGGGGGGGGGYPPLVKDQTISGFFLVKASLKSIVKSQRILVIIQVSIISSLHRL